MKQRTLDELDEHIITILGEKNPQSAQDIHETVKETYPNKPPAVIWSRLLRLVKSGYLDIVHANEEQ